MDTTEREMWARVPRLAAYAVYLVVLWLTYGAWHWTLGGAFLLAAGSSVGMILGVGFVLGIRDGLRGRRDR